MVKNLWDVRTTLSHSDLLAVYVILLLNIFFGLLVAVLAGTVLATLIFAIQYSRSAHYNVYTLRTQHSKLVRPFAHREKLEHMSELALIFVLRGFVFFGSAAKIQTQIQTIVERSQEKPAYRRLRYLIVDMERVTKVDANATGVFLKIARMAAENRFKVFFCGLRDEIHMKLAAQGVLNLKPSATAAAATAGVAEGLDKGVEMKELTPSGSDPSPKSQENDKRFDYTMPSRRRMKTGHSFAFETLDLALEHTEEQLLSYCNVIRAKWLILPRYKCSVCRVLWLYVCTPVLSLTVLYQYTHT
jgi:MFS superfamily sulfate permease-like transporter